MISATEQADQQQMKASNPAVSSFVAASAGSGKTKLLTDRLLRLMLAGNAPERILCLTYTKAAAAEMRIRLNRRLGEWVTMPQEELKQTLSTLSIKTDAETLKRARQLFADVLDLPGGMRIETIHAFCQSLLRRFPLEAQLSPHFAIADDEEATQRLREAREHILANPAMRESIFTLAAEIDEILFAKTSGEFTAAVDPDFLQKDLPSVKQSLREILGLEDEEEEDFLKAFVSPPREIILLDYLRDVAEKGTPTGQKWAQSGLEWLALEKDVRLTKKHLWDATLFTKSGDILKLSKHFGQEKDLKNKADIIKTEVFKEAERVLALKEKLKCLKLVKINLALLEILMPLAKADHEAKALAAELSYADLIEQTSKLLVDPGAAWVLYKLDGGIEHLLLDEVQDTAPEQWKIANMIAAEFFAGEGAKEKPRSIFAVGDPKQSIFSFQGADLKSFEKYRNKFKQSVQAVNREWVDGELSVSFRSTAPVLALTDAVFAEGFARHGVVNPQETLCHGVSRLGQAGCATLWPLTQAHQAPEAPEWDTPDEYMASSSAVSLLASKVGFYIEQRLKQPLLSKNRLARPGDFLILVRSRGALVSALTSDLKARGIDVAGLDRMRLPDQPVVADLLALCDALLLPEDDLAFAQFLVSPLGGLSDESLMELAIDRPGSLVAALYKRADEQEDWKLAKDYYESLRKKTDFETPFSLLAQALGGLGGRAKLLKRFGAEAAEPLDEFLSEALNYTLQEPASLQSFVQRLRLSEQAIKRESEAGGNEVRIMTVHGAKGLQAPIVILPDTVSLPKEDANLLWIDCPASGVKVPVFSSRVDVRPEILKTYQAALRKEQIEEYNRLLYVALTRAEDEILVCGAQGKRNIPDNCWYEAIKAGFLRLAPAEQPDGSLRFTCPQTAKPDAKPEMARNKAAEQLPVWAGTAPQWQALAPVKDQTRPERIVPSRAVEEESSMAVPVSPLVGLQGVDGLRADAMARGTAVHALLEHLPGVKPASQEQAALAYLAAQPALAPQSQQICAAVLKILHDPALAPLFGAMSGAELPLAGVVKGREISGTADRIFIGPKEIIIADYKTDKKPPAQSAGIPEKYTTQMAAYRAILQQIYPEKKVRCLLIWVATAQVMDVPDEMLDKAQLG